MMYNEGKNRILSVLKRVIVVCLCFVFVFLSIPSGSFDSPLLSGIRNKKNENILNADLSQKRDGNNGPVTVGDYTYDGIQTQFLIDGEDVTDEIKTNGYLAAPGEKTTITVSVTGYRYAERLNVAVVPGKLSWGSGWNIYQDGSHSTGLASPGLHSGSTHLDGKTYYRHANCSASVVGKKLEYESSTYTYSRIVDYYTSPKYQLYNSTTGTASNLSGTSGDGNIDYNPLTKSVSVNYDTLGRTVGSNVNGFWSGIPKTYSDLKTHEYNSPTNSLWAQKTAVCAPSCHPGIGGDGSDPTSSSWKAYRLSSSDKYNSTTTDDAFDENNYVKQWNEADDTAYAALSISDEEREPYKFTITVPIDISKLAASDSGTYNVKLDNGAILSDSFDLQIAEGTATSNIQEFVISKDNDVSAKITSEITSKPTTLSDSAVIAYQWYKNDGEKLDGETNAAYDSKKDFTSPGTYSYYCEITLRSVTDDGKMYLTKNGLGKDVIVTTNTVTISVRNPIICVTVTWPDLQFTCENPVWNANKHQYSWSLPGDERYIHVFNDSANGSEIPLKATFSYSGISSGANNADFSGIQGLFDGQSVSVTKNVPLGATVNTGFKLTGSIYTPTVDAFSSGLKCGTCTVSIGAAN